MSEVKDKRKSKKFIEKICVLGGICSFYLEDTFLWGFYGYEVDFISAD